MKDDRLEIKQPIVIVGIGGAGSKLAIISSKLLGCKCVLISNDIEDLDSNCITLFSLIPIHGLIHQLNKDFCSIRSLRQLSQLSRAFRL